MDMNLSSNDALVARIQQLEHERDELQKDIEQLCIQHAGPSYLGVATRMHFQRTAGLEQEIENLKKKLALCTREKLNLQEELSEAYRVKSQLADLHSAEVLKEENFVRRRKTPPSPPPPPPMPAPPPPPTSDIAHRLIYQWSPSYCKSLRDMCDTQKVVNDRFTIHGLWIEINSEEQHYCLYDPFQEIFKNPFRQDLNANWPSIKKWYSNVDIWKYQWYKHGTCYDAPPNYFRDALQLWERQDIYDILNSDGQQYPQGKPHKLGKIRNAIQTQVRERIYIKCEWIYTQLYLMEIHICFDEMLDEVSCDDPGWTYGDVIY